MCRCVAGFLQAEDSLVSQLSHAIKKVAERVTNAPETVEFDYFSSTNFIGLFITEQFAALLKQITTDFAEEMKKSGEDESNKLFSCFFLNSEDINAAFIDSFLFTAAVYTERWAVSCDISWFIKFLTKL